MKRLIGPALSVLLILSSALAQTTQQRGADVGVRVLNERGQAETVKLYKGSYALVIGASNYRYWPRLSGVRDDMPAVRAILERHGFKVEELLDPMGEELLSRINKFINDYGFYDDNRLLIYFSGHGYTEVSGDGRKFGYVVPVDAPKPSKDLIGFRQKALTMDEIVTAARRIRSKHALFVFDSCFSGALLTRGDVRVPPIIDYYVTRPVRQFITSGTDKQEVPDESFFRQVFVRGLEGKADFNKDGYVTGTELAMYLQDEVTNYKDGMQTPQYGKILDPSLDSGDFIFILPASSPPAVADNNNAQALAAQAMSKLMRGDYGEALRLANQSLSLDSSVALAYAVRGRSTSKLDGEETGLADLETANRLDKRNGVLRALLSAAYWNARRNELSKTTAGEALSLLLSPNDDIDFYSRGVAHDVTGDYDAAIADYDKAIGLNPQSHSAYYNRGFAYRIKGDYGRSIADYNRAIGLNPLDYDSYFGRGNVRYFKGDYDGAITDYNKAIELSPRSADFYYNRGVAYYSKDDRGSAIADYSEAIRLNPKHIEARRERADAYEKIGEASKARVDREKADELEKSAVKQ